MGMTISEKNYRQVVFDTDNPFVSLKFRRFIGEYKLPCSYSLKGRYATFVLFLTDDQLHIAEEEFFGIQEYCGKKMQHLNEKMAFLSKYFDSVNIYDATGVGLEVRMKAWESEPVHISCYCDCNDEFIWETFLRRLQVEVDKPVDYWFYNLRDIYLMDASKTLNDCKAMAETIHNRLAACVEAIKSEMEKYMA